MLTWIPLVCLMMTAATSTVQDTPPADLVKAAPPLPKVEPLVDFPVRDTSIILHDGVYYMTGTTGAPTWWKTNEGLRIWKSTDLEKWDDLGMVWAIERDGTWQKKFDKAGRRAIWAPEIHFINGTFWLAYCMNFEGGGTGLLKSTSGKVEGPYEDVNPNGPITSEIDASLFQDDDGTVYFVWQDGKIQAMNKEMTALVGEKHFLKPSNWKFVGFEAAFLFKADGRYYLSCADFIETDGVNQYHAMIASSDKLLGPYGPRTVAVPHGGHNSYFRDKAGQWFSTFFGNDDKAPFKERPAVVPVTIKDGVIAPVK